jgi:hypothetical protein
LAKCVTCQNELDPERAEKYDYCTRPACQAENARGLTIVAVGVNKASDQFAIANDRVKDEMAAGRYQDARRRTFAGHERSPSRRTRPRRTPARAPEETREPTESWTRAQLDRALSMHFTGQLPDWEIAKRLGLKEQTIAKMIATAYAAPAPRRS